MSFPTFDVLLSVSIAGLAGGCLLIGSGVRGLRQLRPCRCGHARDTHRHYRRGSDCGSCACQRYRRAHSKLRRSELRRSRCRVSRADAEWLADALDEHDCPLCDRPLAIHAR